MGSRGSARIHGHFRAGEAGEIAGVSGTTIGQWARWGYIRASQSAGDPHVYAVEDVAEAAIVRALLERGVRHRDVRRAIGQLHRYGEWPLSQAPLATTREPHPRIVLRENGDAYELADRGWQLMTAPPRMEDVRLRLTPGRARGGPTGSGPAPTAAPRRPRRGWLRGRG